VLLRAAKALAPPAAEVNATGQGPEPPQEKSAIVAARLAALSAPAEGLIVICKVCRCRAVLVPRHDRPGQQQLVLDQRTQVERRRQREHVVFAVGIECLGLRLAIDEAQRAIHHQSLAEGLQTALAGRPCDGLRLQVQPSLRESASSAALLTAHTPLHGLGRGVRCRCLHCVPACEFRRRPLPFQIRTLGGHRGHVEVGRIGSARAHRASVSRTPMGQFADERCTRSRPGLHIALSA
jgi:hypothetical protein